MKKKSSRLLVVAHPDDETLFFGGYLLTHPGAWSIVCVTDANADGHGRARMKQFHLAARRLGAKESVCLGFPDRFEKRLDVSALSQVFADWETPPEVFTHGPLGEYGHPHHQDVSFALHTAFAGRTRVFAPAYNCYPSRRVQLTPRAYRIKCEILSQIYGMETERFLHFIPSTSSEGFTEFSHREVENLYLYMTQKKRLDPKLLKNLGWSLPHIRAHHAQYPKRIF